MLPMQIGDLLMKCGICKEDIASAEQVCLKEHPGEWVHLECCKEH